MKRGDGGVPPGCRHGSMGPRSMNQDTSVGDERYGWGAGRLTIERKGNVARGSLIGQNVSGTRRCRRNA